FGPCLKWPWTKLQAPELTEALIDKMVAGTQAQAAGRSIRELERLRDDYLVAIQQVLKHYDIGAGATLRALEERLYEAAAAGARERIQNAVAAGVATDSGEPLYLHVNTPPGKASPMEAGVRARLADLQAAHG